MVLALEAIRWNPSLSMRRVADIYKVSATTLSRRLSGTPSRRDSPPDSKNSTKLEEEAIVDYILDLDARSYPPWMADVEDMANCLLRGCSQPRVGKHCF